MMLDISPCSTETVRCTGIISVFKRCNSVEIEVQDTKYLILIVEAMLHISYPVSRVQWWQQSCVQTLVSMTPPHTNTSFLSITGLHSRILCWECFII